MNEIYGNIACQKVSFKSNVRACTHTQKIRYLNNF